MARSWSDGSPGGRRRLLTVAYLAELDRTRGLTIITECVDADWVPHRSFTVPSLVAARLAVVGYTDFGITQRPGCVTVVYRIATGGMTCRYCRSRMIRFMTLGC